MSELRIRRAAASDVRLISALSITTCYEAYCELDPPHDLADYCFNFLSPDNVLTEFEDRDSTFLIAEKGRAAVGFVKIRENRPIDCVEGRNAIEVQRIYVLERLKGSGIGRRLIEEAAAVGRAKGYELLWLGVWDKNLPAQRFYERVGMRNIGTTDFTDGKSDFVNFVFAIEL